MLYPRRHDQRKVGQEDSDGYVGRQHLEILARPREPWYCRNDRQYEDRQYESERLQHVAKKNDREQDHPQGTLTEGGKEQQDGDARKQRVGNLREHRRVARWLGVKGDHAQNQPADDQQSSYREDSQRIVYF